MTHTPPDNKEPPFVPFTLLDAAATTDLDAGWFSADELRNAARSDAASSTRGWHSLSGSSESILDHMDIDDLRIIETEALEKVTTVTGRLDLGQRFGSAAKRTKPGLLSKMLPSKRSPAVQSKPTPSAVVKPNSPMTPMSRATAPSIAHTQPSVAPAKLSMPVTQSGSPPKTAAVPASPSMAALLEKMGRR